MKSNSQDKVF